MEWYYILLICVGGVILLLTALALVVYTAGFGSRGDKNPLLKYFSPEDLNLKTQPVEISRKWGKLRGYVYFPENSNGKLVVFCHGMGPGQIAYTTEIAYLCKKGFTVIALDSRGCNLSDGKNIGGMYEGVKTALAAIDYAKSDERFKDMPLYLYGHSWGGYSVLVVSAERKVDGVVAVSAPISPAKTLYKGAAAVISKPLAFVLIPFFAVMDFFKFGKKSNLNAAKAADKSGTPVLYIHGDNDKIVPLKYSAYIKAKSKTARKLLVENRMHNPYNSEAAQNLVAELFAKLASARKMSDKEREEYFGGFDFKAATELDLSVMQKISDFLGQSKP